MNKQTFEKIETYMLSCTCDAAHDAEHVYRVLYNALDIAATERGVDYDILLAACLLHDIGRARQYENPELCHAIEGGDMAFEYLSGIGFTERAAAHVKQCIVSHRYRGDALPVTIESKILFDADKVDVSGAVGVARSLFYQGHVGIALYTVDENGNVPDGMCDNGASFFHEYHFKLKHVYDEFFTRRGTEIAGLRRRAMDDYYRSLLREVSESRASGKNLLNGILKE